MTEPAVSPPVAVALAAVGFFTLVIAGFGLLSLLSGAEVLTVSGLGALPGAVATGAATGVFLLAAWLTVRRARPSYSGVPVIVLATVLSYGAGLLIGATFAGIDAARAVAALGGFATSWFAVVLAAAALVAGWAAVALVRTRAGRPRWPWERDDE